MLMIGLVIIYFIFLDKKTAEIDNPKTTVPKYSAVSYTHLTLPTN